VPNPDILSAFGAVRSSDGAMTLMVVNKDINNASPFNATITNFPAAGTAQVWQLNSGNVITHLPDTTLTNNIISATVPSQSITLFVVQSQPVAATLAAGPARSDGNFQFTLTGQQGQVWVLQSSTDLANWSPVSTNTLLSNQMTITLPGGAAKKFYRAHTP
jgi:hypothetical protein